jgi:hypothetical protein
MKNLHAGEKIILCSLITSALCFYPFFWMDKFIHTSSSHRDAFDMTSLAPYFLFSAAITIPMMIEASFDLIYGVLPRKINTCRLTLMASVFAYSLILYTYQNHKDSAALYVCCTQARLIITVACMLSFMILEESTAFMKNGSIFLSFLTTIIILLRVTNGIVNASNKIEFILSILQIICFLLTFAMIIHYISWYQRNKERMTPEKAFPGIAIVIFFIIMAARQSVYVALVLMTGYTPTIYTMPMTTVKTIFAIEIIGVLAILIVPGRIVGHYATANKVSSISSIDSILLYTYCMITGEIAVQT